jgi:hypothetical protein
MLLQGTMALSRLDALTRGGDVVWAVCDESLRIVDHGRSLARLGVNPSQGGRIPEMCEEDLSEKDAEQREQSLAAGQAVSGVARWPTGAAIYIILPLADRVLYLARLMREAYPGQ